MANQKNMVAPLQDRISQIKTEFTEPFDLKAREFKIAGKFDAVCFFVDTIAGGGRVSLEILPSLSRLQNVTDVRDGQTTKASNNKNQSTEKKTSESKKILDFVTKELLTICDFAVKETFEDAKNELLNGKTVMIIDGVAEYISLDTTVFPARGIAEPPTNSVVLGPREGFTENLVMNIGLVRKRLKTSDLVLVNNPVGKYTSTNVSVMYIKSIADQEIVDDVIKRIKSIEIDGILDSFYIMQYLQGENMNIFRQVGNSEKPDVVASKILEGRIAIFVDGSPIVLTVPYVLLEDIQAADDYYTNSSIVTLRRFIRIFGAVLAITLPGLYIAMQLYHYNIIPLNTLFLVTNSVENTPFSPMLEMIVVLVLFEIMYEAALRMPRHLGAATGLVAALVLGGTAVDAGLMSAPAVLVAALSLITMYILPSLAPQISLLRFIFVIIGGMLGLYGIILGGILLVIYLCSLDNFGTPMLAPFAPYVKGDMRDAIIMENIKDRKGRPESYSVKNKTRAK
ncbi:MAG: spore germination protein [Firmicutes bacterium]|nr:spore germination protein [Bacillota bacterium]